ncbi:nucleotide exchange factor SIL1 isoform X3 [Pangasianodon hypophthalmus]|uniref:nucleotide exchange factor SIL1 isoform X3 n=1 Tax=Pangasianodon hypophthalmus TaxID=310915 RepID=UPI00147F4569|nr:nucleotide exchange factor SIL1 isoform X3 [Pangasianodon hypophthalmus]
MHLKVVCHPPLKHQEEEKAEAAEEEGKEVVVFPVALTITENLNEFNKAEDTHEPDPKNLDVFDPSPNWQTLKPGQAVPAGSHVRLNLQTGQREAKLGDEEYLPGRKSTRGMLNKHTPLFTSQELKQALKKFKGEDDTTKKDSEQGKESSQALVRSMDELKRDLAMLDLLVETDVQIMSKLLSNFSSTNTTMDQRVAALLDLEYLVHQVDNAQNLVLMGGLELVNDALNNTDFRLQKSAAFVLGSAVSSNPSVQVVALECGTLQKLLTMLATPRPMTVKKKVLYALACLLRHFPTAQSQFVKLGGLQVLVELFQAQGAECLHVRIITLLYDMITEKEMISQAGIGPHSTHQEHLQQYSDISLFPMLVEQGWCSLVPEMLASPEHDWREKALQTLLAMMPHCQKLYLQNPTLSTSLSFLQQQYQELALRERSLGEDDGYFGEILFLVDSVMVKMH